MKKQHPKRQATRKALIFISLLLLPITMNYLSPYVIIDGAFQGIINGSFVLFALLFVSALFVGRLWCGWLCPAGGMGEACFMISDKSARGGRFNWIKWGIWIPWVGIIAYGALSAGGYTRIDLLHQTENVISVDAPSRYIIYGLRALHHGGQARSLPLRLLDGAFHDPGPQGAQQAEDTGAASSG
jgi:hypothetical protein